MKIIEVFYSRELVSFKNANFPKLLMSDHVLKVPQMYFNYKGRVHFQEWYKLVYNLLIEKGYTSAENPGDPNYAEYYSQINLSNGAKQHWIWWRTISVRDEMFTFYINVEFQTLNLKTIEVMHNGKKIKVNDGETNTFINGRMVIDPKGIWNKNWLSRELFDLIQRKHFEEQIDQEYTKLYEDLLEVHDRAKQALGCYTVKPREAYHIDDKAFPDV